jgi:hypothetical protein
MGEPTTSFARMRRVFLIVADHGLELAVYADLPVSTTIDEFLDHALPSLLESDADNPCRLQKASDCAVFDDAMQRLPDDIRAGSIPAPGIVYIIPRSATSLTDLGLETDESLDADGLDLALLRQLLYHAVRLSDSAGPRLARFLAGPDALFAPDPLPIYDAFISFTTPDFLTASDLMLGLTERGSSCFLANMSIAAGALWNDELKMALKASRHLLLVASSEAAESSWVLSEVGAAWVLNVPIIVVPTGEAPWATTTFLGHDDVQEASLDDIDTLAGLIGSGEVR